MIRLGVLLVLFLLSLLTVFNAPAYPFWLLAILVAEYSWLFILLVMGLLGAGIWLRAYQFANIIVGCLAIIFFSRPIVSAYQLSGRLDAEFDKAFQIRSDSQSSPFGFSKMFSKALNASYQSLSYTSYRKPATDSTFYLTLDYYQANKSGSRPCVVVIHGGSWSSGDSRQLPELNAYLAQAGYNVASVNYRLAPAYHSPAPVEDVNQAIRFLKQHAQQLRIDTNQFVLLGRSAGGQIALLAAYALHHEGIVGVIDFYGPADMVWGYAKPANPLVFNSRKIMERYLGGTYQQIPQQYKISSPIEYVNSKTVPTLMIHGKNDVLVAYEHSIKLNRKLADGHVKHYLLSLPWATHGFDFNINGPGGQLSTYAVMRFMQVVTH